MDRSELINNLKKLPYDGSEKVINLDTEISQRDVVQLREWGYITAVPMKYGSKMSVALTELGKEVIELED